MSARRQSLTSGSETTTNTYNDGEQLVSAAVSGGQTTTYGYDNDGQLTSAQVGTAAPTTFGYDPLGELTQAGSDTYAYDINGNRVSQTSGGVTTTQTFDGSDVIQQADSSGNTTSYLYGADGLVSQTDPAGDVSYYGHDALGSVTALTSGATGAITDEYAYDAFGENTERSGSAAQPFGFMGNQTDATTGLDDFNAREYDPTDGRFLSEDPVAANPMDPQTIDRYAYGTDNPFGNPDPTGLCGAGSLGDLVNSINPFSSQNCAYQGAVGIKTDVVGGAEGMYNSAPGAWNEVMHDASYYLAEAQSELGQDVGALKRLGIDTVNAWATFARAHSGLLSAIAVTAGCAVPGVGTVACATMGLVALVTGEATAYHQWKQGDHAKAAANGLEAVLTGIPAVGVSAIEFEGTSRAVVQAIWSAIAVSSGATWDAAAQ